jgi:hypothetical protein
MKAPGYAKVLGVNWSKLQHKPKITYPNIGNEGIGAANNRRL